MKLIKIEQSCAEITFPHVSHLLEKARLTLWVGCSEEHKRIVFAGVTSIINYPQYSALIVTHVGGEDNKFIKYVNDIWHEDSELMRYAKLHNLKRIEILGRNGWLRVLNKVGFRKSYTALTKDI